MDGKREGGEGRRMRDRWKERDEESERRELDFMVMMGRGDRLGWGKRSLQV